MGTLRVGTLRVLVLLAGLVPLLLAGCTQQAGAVQLAADQTLTWPLTSEAKIAYDEMLDPASMSSLADYATIDMLYVGLVRLDGNLNVQPDAATAMPDISPDGLKYTFHLRPGMKFSDGNPLTAKDFAFSIDRALDPNLCSSDTSDPDPDTDAATYASASAVNQCAPEGAAYLNHVLGATDRGNGKGWKDHSVVNPTAGSDNPQYGVNVLDDLTIVLRLDQPVSYFLEALTYPTAFAVEKSFVEKYPHGKWVDHLDQGGCSGPFMVKSYGDGTQMTMVPNPNWESAFGQQITLKQVVRPLVEDPEVEYKNYLSGQYDYADVPGDDFVTAKGQGDFNNLAMLAEHYFGLNWHRAPFDNLQVRQAFALTLDKQLIVDRVENGAAAPTNHIVPRGMPGYNQSLVLPDGTFSLTGDTDAAKTLIAKARAQCPSYVYLSDTTHQYCKYLGVPGTSGSEQHSCKSWQKYNVTPPAAGVIDIYTSRADTPRELTTVAAQEWESVLGVTINVVPVTGGERNALVGDSDPLCRPQAWNFGWAADYPDPQDWLSLQFATGEYYNASGVSDPKLDSMLAAADRDPVATPDQVQKRIADYNAAEQYINNQVAWIPYQQDFFSFRERHWVNGLALNAQDFVPDVAWANVTILQH